MTHGLDEAVRRARLYKDAGADVLFVEGLRSRTEIEHIGRELPPLLAINLIEGGDTPMLTLDELEVLGFFSVGVVLSGLYAAAHALDRTYREIRARGSTSAVGDRMLSFADFGAVVDRERRYADDERFKA